MEQEMQFGAAPQAESVHAEASLYSSQVKLNEFLDDSFGRSVEVTEYFPDIQKFIQTVNTIQKVVGTSLLDEKRIGPSHSPYVVAGTGTAIVLFGLFGCFATCRGRPRMLKLYAVFLCLVFMTVLIAGNFGFVFRHKVKGAFLN
ncbi:unnamed protein product [Pleuronectes platessa]|uniref:Uncharacterized protein n=1 Tax=Pleuronectes platessa TaxID=8262 RepID=A0A9N7V9N7_PLEPL|nr:unnamed protein product [Pleuronectes platessa]